MNPVCQSLFFVRRPLSGKQFPKHCQCRATIAALRHKALKHHAFVINRPLEIKPLTVDFHKHLVDVPASVGVHIGTSPSDLFGKNRAKAVPPKADGLVANIDAALVQDILDLAQAERIPDVVHHRQLDDFGTGYEILERGQLVMI